MDLKFVDYNELKEIAPFSIFVLEYFKNDFNVVKDFLGNSSPWDDSIKCFFKINDKELITKKRLMTNSIINVYTKVIEELKVEDESDGLVKISSIDYYCCKGLLFYKSKVKAFFVDDKISLNFFRVYIEVLHNKYNINIDTSNYYKQDLLNIVDCYMKKYERFSVYGNKKIISGYLSDLVATVDNYFIENFRSDEDLKSFLDYYFSIIYAYLKTNNCSGEFNEIESKFIRCYEDNDKSLYEFYCSNFDIRYYLIVCLYNIYIKHDVQFDMRDNIKDLKSIDLFKLRDVNYSLKNTNDIIIDNYNAEFKFKILINNLFKIPVDEIKSILLGRDSIYDVLYLVGLDARYGDYYKVKIIKKILCDCLTFSIYLETNYKEYDNKIINGIKDIAHDDDLLVKYFKENFNVIYNLYLEYLNSSEYVKEQILMNAIKLDKLRELEKINKYTVAQYFDIFLGRIKQLYSVDCMNYYIENIKSLEEIDDSIYNEYGIDNMIRIIALNVYENTILLNNLTIEQKIVKKVIEDEINISSFAQNTKPFLELLINEFIGFNNENISYNEELNKRKQIKSLYAKCILKRLNPYQEG